MVFLYERIISDDHPALKILHDLETTAYYVGSSSSSSWLSRFIIQSILRWADTLTPSWDCHLKVVRPIYCVSLF